MASLTPGVLSKLLENVGNRNAKVAGEHRTALLQVIGIVPALVGGDDGDPWRSKGFFLRVSDSVHSAYVSISDEDVDLILSDKIQLGQFIHVARLDSASPVPVLRGVKPVPRRRPCVGEPKDLISSDSLTIPTAAGKKGSKKLIKREAKAATEAKANAKARRSVCEPSRRLSMENGKVEEGVEMRRLSLDSTRRGWDRSSANRSSPRRPLSRSKPKDASRSSDTSSEVHLSRKVSSEKNSTVKRSNPIVSPLKNKNENLSQKVISKPLGRDSKLASRGSLPSNVIKVPLSFKTWSDRNVSWDSLPYPIHDIGKQVMGHRDLAFLAAVRALEEASAAESVIQCMSMFAELCQSSLKDSAGKLVEQFLDLHQGMQKAAAVVDAILNSRLQEPKTGPCSPHPLPEICESFPTKNAVSWVLAAVESDLSKFCLFKKKDEKMEILNSEKCLVVLENTLKKFESESHSSQRKQSPKNHGSSLSQSLVKGPSPMPKRLSVTKRPETERVELSKGSGLKEVATLAKKLLLVSDSWFLNYLEGSLNRGFGLRTGESGCEITSLLRQLKGVNQWLDDSVLDGNGTDEKIEGLRKKLYGFLQEHVDSAAGSKIGS